MEIINAADAIPASGFPEFTSMLVLLIALAVVISLLAEIACGLMQDRYGMRWVRPEVGEHHAIMRQLGRMR